MGRYRAPAPQSSLYITRRGFLALQEELNGLWKRRADVTRALSAAAAEGDRSENAEYIYRKKELREIDRRVRYLQKRLPVLKVVNAPPSDPERVFFGAHVTLEDENGSEVNYRIVGPDEFDTARGWISMDSPMARALMKKCLDDEVMVHTPSGNICYCITALRYEEDMSS
jgi:transcription elongation factor GreB